MHIVDTILGVSKDLLARGDLLGTAPRDRRDRVAAFLDAVGQCVADVAESLKARQVPHAECAEIERYANDLPDVLKDELGSREADELGRRLRVAHEVERLVVELSKAAFPAEEIAKLDQASGMFKAAAIVARPK